MDSLILWGLVAFLIVDVLLIVLVARSGESRTMLDSGRTTVQQALMEEPHSVELEGQLPSENATALPSPAVPTPAGQERAKNSQQAAQPAGESRDGQQYTPLSTEQLYLRQRAHTLETRLAEIDSAPDAGADYRRGMKVVLEEELHSLWARLSELETEESKVNHTLTR